jgi:hypothetical protein
MASSAPASHLVEIADPPVPSRSYPVVDKAPAEKLQTFAMCLGIAVGSGAASWFLLQLGYRFYGFGAGAVGVFAVIAAFGGSTLKSTCPYCASGIDSILNREEGRQVQCEKCFEYSTVNVGILRPLDPSTKSERPKFESPVYKKAVWPNACVACGEPPVRCDDLSKTTVGAIPALMGHLQIIRGSVSGIPYCDKHRDKMALKVGSDKKLLLQWTSLRMMRRYLAANRSQPVY